MDLQQVMTGLSNIEAKMTTMSTKADEEMKNLGKVTADTKTALDTLGTQQRELAERLVAIEQKGNAPPAEGEKRNLSWGEQFVKDASFKDFANGQRSKMRVEVKNTDLFQQNEDGTWSQKNTILTTDTGITGQYTLRRPGVIGGAFRNLTVESMINTIPTTANAVEFVRENVFTNNAAEVAEGAQKPESSITFVAVNMPIQTIAHWLKISRQLAADAPALVAYINSRMRYGVNLRVENQLITGNGTSPNISGMMDTGNFTLHGYTAAALTALAISTTVANRMIDLIRLVIADCWASDYPADTIVMNPADWARIEMAKDADGNYIIGDPANRTEPRLWGLPVIQTNAMAVDTFLVGAFGQAMTLYNREGVVVDMSESDADNFTKNLITIRAERRCMLAVERPASLRGGDLTPA